MTDRFLNQALAGPTLLDAAMGTRLIALGLDLGGDDPCLWNQTHPEVIGNIHRRDLDVGAAAIFTNTFGANRPTLDRLGRSDSVAEINRQGVILARAEAGPDQFVVGSIGPMAMRDETSFREQADALLEAGVDALVLETFRFDQAVQALPLLEGAEVPILVGLYSWPDPVAVTARRLLDAGATIVGANCFADLDLARRLIAELPQVASGLFWLKPSTGTPDAPWGIADFVSIAASCAEVGGGMLGGCCGTSEDHLKAIREVWSCR